MAQVTPPGKRAALDIFRGAAGPGCSGWSFIFSRDILEHQYYWLM
jgi:hypothetical protein